MSGQRCLVLVTVDCFRADHAGWLGYQRPTTPFLDSLAGKSLVFEKAIVAGLPTYYSLPAILASRHPLVLGRDLVGLAPGEVTLTSILREQGYATGAFVAGNPYLSPNFGYDSGFDVFEDFAGGANREVDTSAEAHDQIESSPRSWKQVLKRNVNRRLRSLSYGVGQGGLYEDMYFDYCQRQCPPCDSWETLRRFPAADEIVDHACQWLSRNQGRPFFLWLHFMDPHAPYYPRAESIRAMGERADPARARYVNAYWNRSDLGEERLMSKRREIVSLYDAGIRSVDGQIERLMQFLSRGRFGNECVFALTADHGEAFLEHGNRYHAPAAAEELIRVPLLIHAPDAIAHRIGAPFSLLHLAPTLLEALGISVPPEFRGVSHWSHRLGSGDPRPDRSLPEGAICECIANCKNPFRLEDRMGARILCVRQERYKLVIDFSLGQELLFDLRLDPAEVSPLQSNQMSKVRTQLLRHAFAHLACSGDTYRPDASLALRLRDLRRDGVKSEKFAFA